ncbi:DUF4381 domain-containing protein [Alteromonas sp. 1_MG-2023]|uniref:DUF4381 domain-containing protein n=1 Tax=Alteromonas sp. 1_MG-2023 TaxID=3062669 RepID=UPI0026E39610|nr:DUF4381 domain-containing protein [Alteromonas sp. 1_MG-2023]MDO6567084.1 DUF4381 domain-containing protein [Alteromonas sp. 1_MG-2023]
MQSAQGMPQTDPLAQLKDVHVPDNVDVWPLDWGWWCLIVLCLAGTISLIIYLVKKHKFNKPRRDALKLLGSISSADENWPMQINNVLKRTAVTYFKPQEVAGLYGNSWHEFLLKTLPDRRKTTMSDSLSILHSQQYAPKCDNKYFDECIQAANAWVKYFKVTSVMNNVEKQVAQKSSLLDPQKSQEATHA